MNIKVEDNGNTKTVTVSLPDYKTPRSRVSYSSRELSEKLYEKLDLEGYLFDSENSSGTICNYQINNTGTYIFIKNVKIPEIVKETPEEKDTTTENTTTTTTTKQTNKQSTSKKRKKYASKK